MMKNPLRYKTNGIFNFMDYKKPINRVFYYVILTLFSLSLLLTLFPIIWLFASSFKEANEVFSTNFRLFPRSISWDLIWEACQKLKVWGYMLNSLIVVLGAVVCSVVFNGLLAYVISILKPKGYKIILVMFMATLMIPAVTNMRTLLNNIVKLDLMGSYIPLWFAYGANAFYFVMFKTYFDKLPKEIFDAAEIDGCNKLQIFFKIVFPLSLPIISVIAIFTTNAAWSDFLLPYLVLQSSVDRQTLMVRIFIYASSSSQIINELLLLLSLSIIPVIILFTIFQKQITNSGVNDGMKG